MEGLVVLFLLSLVGAAALIVWVIAAILRALTGGSRVRALEAEQILLKESLSEVEGRLGRAESALAQTRREVYALRSEAPSARAHFAASAPEPLPIAAPAPIEVPRWSPRTEHRPMRVEEPLRVAAPVRVEEPLDEGAPALADASRREEAMSREEVVVREAVAPRKEAVLREEVVSRKEAVSREEVVSRKEAVSREAVASREEAVSRDEAPMPAPAEPTAGFRPDWERWIGVRGAAALGACVLVIAGLYFFKYSMEQGLISPALRVALGALTGVVGLAASERMIRRDYSVLANWLAGAGIAILYITFWAAHGVYGLIGMPLSFSLMILVTGLCGFFALRRRAMVIAVLGLFGGFATPVALSSGSDHPIGLFGYLLLLDVALLYLAHKRSWPVLGALSLGGTVLYQAGWIGERMGPDRLPLGIAIVLLFSALFAAALQRIPSEHSRSIVLARAAAFVLPFVFGAYFGLRSDLGPHLYPIGAMVILVSVGALVLEQRGRAPYLGVGSAVGSVAVFGAWLTRHDPSAIALEVTALLCLLATIVHVASEVAHRRASVDPRWTARAATVATFGALLLLGGTLVSAAGREPGAFLAGVLFVSALGLRQALITRTSAPRLAVAVALNLLFPLVHWAHEGEIGFPAPSVQWLALAVVSALALHACQEIRKAASRDEAEELPLRALPLSSDGIIVLLPFALAVYFGVHGDAAAHLWPLGSMVVLLSAASSRFALGPTKQPLGLITALTSVAVLAAWTICHDPEPATWEIIGLFSLLAALLHGSLEAVLRGEGHEDITSASVQAAAASLGALLVLLGVAIASSTQNPWPWLGGAAFAAALTLRHAGVEGKGVLHLAVAIPMSLGLLALHLVHLLGTGALSADLHLGLALGLAGSLQLVAHLRRREEEQRWATHAAAAASLILLFDTLVDPSGATPRWALGGTTALAALSLVSAARLGQGIWMPVSLLVTAFVQTAWAFDIIPDHPVGDYARALSLLTLAGLSLTAALFTFAPFVAGKALRENPWAFRSAAFAGTAMSLALHHVFVARFGQDQIGLLPVGLAALAGAAGLLATRALPREAPIRATALVWLFALPGALITVAVPMQLENEQITIAWAIEGALVIYAWRRLDHAALKYLGLGLLGVVTARLVANPYVLGYHPRSSTPVLNWLLPTYVLPALALLAAYRWLRGLEISRLRPWEGVAHEGRRAHAARALASAAIVVIFAFINLTILDAFGSGRDLQLFVERLPARDLSLSLAWAVYALTLLSIGMLRSKASLRWCSLALIIVTLGKVFLYDLAHLHDLYRVASLVGLAFSLILISLAYQRFVFARAERPA